MITNSEIRWPVDMDNEHRTPEEEIRRGACEHDEVRKQRLPLTTNCEIRWPVDMDNEPRPLEQEIRLRAFVHYEARDRKDGHDVDDWLRAEREVTQGQSRAAAA